MSVKGGMQDQLNHYYAPNTKIGKAWNRVQVKVSVGLFNAVIEIMKIKDSTMC